jgi:uncharacterized membrane protein
MDGDNRKPQANIIAALTYLLGFVTGLIFLYLEPYNQDEFIRFHARQSIGFSVAWFAIAVVFGVFIAVLPHGLGALLNFILTIIDIALAVFWVVLMYKAYNGERYRIRRVTALPLALLGRGLKVRVLIQRAFSSRAIQDSASASATCSRA